MATPHVVSDVVLCMHHILELVNRSMHANNFQIVVCIVWLNLMIGSEFTIVFNTACSNESSISLLYVYIWLIVHYHMTLLYVQCIKHASMCNIPACNATCLN